MMKNMMHVTTQRDLTDILRDFDPNDTVTEAMVLMGAMNTKRGIPMKDLKHLLNVNLRNSKRILTLISPMLQ
jgi:Ca2+-binding EF-hand superfamily protein